MTILENYQLVLEKIRAARARFLLAGEVDATLVVVSKTQEAEAILPLLAAGQRVFGENRVQEAEGKWPALKAEFDDVRLHLIGPLQSNKAAEAVALFDVIETVDREKIARALKVEMDKQGRQLPCLVQVNTGDEPQKAGVLPAELVEFVALCGRIGLDVRGLMCIPPANEPAAPHFAFLAKLAAEAGIDELSMGMSGDFEVAAAMGARFVRVGSAVFGEGSDGGGFLAKEKAL